MSMISMTTPPVEFLTGTIEYLRVDSLSVDHAVQRVYLNKNIIRKIVNDPQEKAFGIFLVSQRSATELHVVDGQHRLLALNELILLGKLPEDYAHKCEVFRGLTPKQEAELFVLRNDRSAIESIENFRIRIRAEDPIAVGAAHILGKYGWRIAMGKSPGCFAAASTLLNSFEASPEATDQALKVVTATWGLETGAANGNLFEGITAFLRRHSAVLDEARLIEKLRKTGPERFRGEACAHRDTVGGSLRDAIAELLTLRYNANMKSRALPPWRTGRG